LVKEDKDRKAGDPGEAQGKTIKAKAKSLEKREVTNP
jgi:hypothetical protein